MRVGRANSSDFVDGKVNAKVWHGRDGCVQGQRAAIRGNKMIDFHGTGAAIPGWGIPVQVIAGWDLNRHVRMIQMPV